MKLQRKYMGNAGSFCSNPKLIVALTQGTNPRDNVAQISRHSSHKAGDDFPQSSTVEGERGVVYFLVNYF
jgi:hypothetical protein